MVLDQSVSWYWIKHQDGIGSVSMLVLEQASRGYWISQQAGIGSSIKMLLDQAESWYWISHYKLIVFFWIFKSKLLLDSQF